VFLLREIQGYLLVYSADVFPYLFELFVGILNSGVSASVGYAWSISGMTNWQELVECFKVLL
jgi:hypothetical protein